VSAAVTLAVSKDCYSLRKRKKNLSSYISTLTDIRTGFTFDALLGNFAIQTSIRIPYINGALYVFF
jgi:hypothetical protein